ncbi:hypothetical protein SAMN02745121_02078 [Nannocystis exedens]|uniref:Uncharacterized protein n=1 Tax=Nannocystis exedens TaxID=54 RepID=A0A1I1VYK4_9BACT|nr:hypothetical protein [Nannocystis exedens]PCC72960.1 hypothetical protein NAEX_06046 [Nannocystis exedens]SFD87935.1 hypothetical protein SAMN02745121_02078 [Nannocystis exedens]
MKNRTLSLLALMLFTPACDAPDSPAVDLQPIGEPTWQLVDFHRFSAPVGTSATQYAEARQTTAAVLPAPNHLPHPDLGIGPGAKHIDAYWAEMAEGIANAGFDEEDPFVPADVNGGNGLFTTFMAVPRFGHEAFGSSPDYKFGPIISHDVFPIHLSSDLWRDGTEVGLHVEFDIQALDAITPSFAVDGHSHFPLYLWYWWNNQGTPTPGEYAWHVTMTDATGAGWTVKVPAELLGAQALVQQGAAKALSAGAEAPAEPAEIQVGFAGG